MQGDKLQEGDEVLDVSLLKEQNSIVLQSEQGYFLKFAIEEIPEKKKAAVGVRGMKLGEKDRLEAVHYVENGTDTVIPYKSRQLVLNQMKTAKRDGKPTKVRG